MKVCRPASARQSHRRLRDPCWPEAWDPREREGGTVSFFGKLNSPGPSPPGQSAPSPRPHPTQGSRGERGGGSGRDLGAAAVAPPEPRGAGVPAAARAPAPGMLRAQVREQRRWGEGEGAAAAAAAVRSGPGGAAQSSRSCARTAARARAHKLPAAERGAASSCAQPLAPARRRWPAPGRSPRDTTPRCKAGPQPLAPRRSRLSLLASPLPNPAAGRCGSRPQSVCRDTCMTLGRKVLQLVSCVAIALCWKGPPDSSVKCTHVHLARFWFTGSSLSQGIYLILSRHVERAQVQLWKAQALPHRNMGVRVLTEWGTSAWPWPWGWKPCWMGEISEPRPPHTSLSDLLIQSH
ncbi:PTB-containing, cubilin and LRP1-interacting protein isoform X3 [Rousettus aegyptiacus]|uniref:PTB-containing, cubilin and LRP1-interacting protein isoform X3 n=1 Tax=Rousettus aegyptiacus TaxID=9407 RepID=UPI00168CC369|nr:PTB-containing, cubilin and LRP1-interacting protein isoform X3 [Rousettus aegyptiacus]